ncbi:MAG TPA: hypothetical protein VJQ25_01710, partial [Nitrospira sp.]|nr:hypothetical protein [Nitrospira sp.]
MSRPPAFLGKSHFQPEGNGFRFLPFRFMRWSQSEVLLVNEVGEFLFVHRNDFRRILGRALGRDEDLY